MAAAVCESCCLSEEALSFAKSAGMERRWWSSLNWSKIVPSPYSPKILAYATTLPCTTSREQWQPYCKGKLMQQVLTGPYAAKTSILAAWGPLQLLQNVCVCVCVCPRPLGQELWQVLANYPAIIIIGHPRTFPLGMLLPSLARQWEGTDSTEGLSASARMKAQFFKVHLSLHHSTQCRNHSLTHPTGKNSTPIPP